MLEAGSKAPDFTLKDQNGKTITLSDFSGETVVLYFYPKANTSGCTTQACGVRDHMAEYNNAGAKVIGVSPDDVKAIKKFDKANDFGFTLLADKDHKVSDMYGTWVEKSMYGNTYMGVQRATFIISGDSKIVRVFPKVQPKKHDDVVLKALVEINTTV
ncbi:MAG: thioredoxin-dependent thiol peroxidase [Solirubrobacterales bacterium]